MARRSVFVAAGLLGLAALAVANSPAQWQATVGFEVAAPVSEVLPFVASARAWTGWLGWVESDDATLSWSFDGANEAAWSGQRLGRGVLRVLPGDNGYDFAMVPERGLRWEGSMDVTSSGDESRVEWVARGDFAGRPLLRLLGGEAGSAASERMKVSLSRLRVAILRSEALRAEADRLAAEDAAIAADIAQQNSGEHQPIVDDGPAVEAVE